MTRSILLVIALALVASGPAVARPVDPPNFEEWQPADEFPARPDGISSTAAQDTAYFGGTQWNAVDMRWEAIPGGTWTFDSGVGTDYNNFSDDVNPFKDPSLHTHMEGWVGIDLTYSRLPYFRRLGVSDPDWSGSVCVGSSAGLGGSWSMWCGSLGGEMPALTYASGQGYGDSWRIGLERPFSYTGAATTLEFDYVVDSEPGFDSTRVFVQSGGVETRVLVAGYDGSSSGHAVLTLAPGIELPPAAGTVRIVFEFTSDAGYSDEDGRFATACGAFAFDNVRLTGGIVYGPQGFEEGDDGWVLSPPIPGPGGDWSDLIDVANLSLPPTACGCLLSGNVLLFDDGADDDEQGDGGHPYYADNIAASPWIDLKAAGLETRPGRFIETHIYANLPLSNYIFVQYQVQWYPYVYGSGEVAVSPLLDNGFITYYGGVPTCTTVDTAPTRTTNFPFTATVERVRIAVGVINNCRFYGNCTGFSNDTPWFDDIRFGVCGVPGAPLLSTQPVDRPQDAFPENGTIAFNAPVRVDCNTVKGPPSPYPGSSLGDTLIVRSVAVGNTEVRVVFAVSPGPGVDYDRLTAWLARHRWEETALGLDWYSARMDTAQNGASRVLNQWMTAYHEADPNFRGMDTDLDPNDLNPGNGQSRLLNDIFPDDLFTPGTRLLLYYKAQSTTGVEWYYHPDWTAGQYFEMEALPSSMEADGSHNRVLYVDHYGNAGGQAAIEALLSAALPGGGNNFEGTAWDRWNTQAPTSNKLSFGRPPDTEYGATAAQLAAYDVVLWNSGANSAYNLTPYDANVLKLWLADGSPSRTLYLNGNDLAWSLGSTDLLTEYCGATYVCTSVRTAGCAGGAEDPVSCMPLEGAAAPQFPVAPGVARGNGCPSVYNFDVLQVSPTAAGGAQGNLTYVGPAKGTVSFASVSHVKTGSPSYRTVVDGFSLHTLRDPGCAGSGAAVERLASILGWANPDSDGDGIPDDADACPDLSTGPGELDRNLDGCPDPTSSFRFIRFWNADQIPVTYETDAVGDPANPDGSDFAALAAGFSTWTSVPGVTLAGGDDLTRGGPSVVTAGDRRNSISFTDPAGFIFGTLAVAPATVAVGDTTIGGRAFRAGEIVDVDILFNTRDFAFSTPTYDAGPGSWDLQSLATHELGHFFGLSHTPVESSTMFYVVPRGTGASTLAADDIVLTRRGYGSQEPALSLEGRVLHPDGTTPVSGAAVLAVAAATGDTLQMTITGRRGGYRFYEVGESFRVYVLPIDGSSAVNYLAPAAVNPLFAEHAETGFLPEYWDEATETNADFAGTGFVVTVPGTPVTGADVILNVDQDPPLVVSTTPVAGAPAARTTGALLVSFNERLDAAAFRSDPDIRLRNMDLDVGVGGSAALLQEDRLISFIPSAPLAWDTDYELRIGPDLYDLSGNPMTAMVTVPFHAEPQPPVSLASASPLELPVGGVLALSGAGFDPLVANNLVLFAGGVSAHPVEAAPDRIAVPVPIGAVSGNVSVQVGALVSNALPITVVLPLALPVGNAVEEAVLTDRPRAMDLSPDGTTAWFASGAGVAWLPALPTDPQFLQPTLIPIAGGAIAVAALGTGDAVIALAPDPPRLCLIDAAAKLVVAEAPLTATPYGMAEVPGGREVILAYSSRVVLHEAAPGARFGSELREWSGYRVSFGSRVAVSPTGREAYATASENRVAVLGLGAGEGIVAYLEGSGAVRDIAGALDGSRVLTAEWGGTLGVHGVRGPAVEALNFPGGLSSVVMAPDGVCAYVTDFVRNRVEIIDVSGAVTVPVGGFATGVDPIEVKVGSGGRYVYVLCDDASELRVYDTTAGPRLASAWPPSGGTGTLITLVGSGFDPVPANNTVFIGDAAQTPVAVSADGAILVARQTGGGGDAISVRTGGLASNTLPWRVVARPDAGDLFAAGSIFQGLSSGFAHVLESPDGAILVALHADGGASVLRADPSGSDLLRPIQTLDPASTGLVDHRAMVFAPDSRTLFVAEASRVAVFDVATTSAAPLARVGSVEEGGVPADLAAGALAMTPDGRRLLALGVDELHEIDATSRTVLSTVAVSTGTALSVAVHPMGHVAFVGGTNAGTAVAREIDLDPDSPTYRQILASHPVGTGNIPLGLSTSPDGRGLYALHRVSDFGQYRVARLDIETGSPTRGTVTAATLVGTVAPCMLPNRSGTVLCLVAAGGILEARALQSDTLAPLVMLPPQPLMTVVSPPAISRDDARLYVGGPSGAVHILDVATVTAHGSVSGFDQTPVAGQPLPAPLVVRAESAAPAPAEGSVVRFTTTGGNFGYPDHVAFAVADATGFAGADYVAGTAPGDDTITITTSLGSWTEVLTVVPDTTLTSPKLLQVSPAASQTTGVDTRVAADFSKAIKPSTVHAGTFLVRPPGGPAVPGFYSFTEGGRRVVFTPVPVLGYDTAYEIVVAAGLTDYNGHPLENPATIPFRTAPQPPPTLSALDPPAGRAGTPLVLSGEGFRAVPGENTVRFGTREAPVIAGETGWLVTSVPLDAETGPVRVSAGSTPSNELNFTVLVPDPDFLNRVTENVPVPASGQAVVIIPDRSRAYMTAPGVNSVVPIVIEDRHSEAAIGTGKYPFGAACSPSGDRIYVTNFYSNTISVIDVDPDHPTFQQVVATIRTGFHPTAVAVHPDGRSLYVVHYGDTQLLTVDTDSTSASQYYARSSITTGSTSSSVVVTPDGGLIVVGTGTGLFIVNAADGSARTNVNLGSSTGSVAVTPDGAFALALSENGTLYLVDIQPGSPWEGMARTSIQSGSTSGSVGVSPDGGSIFVTKAGRHVGVYRLVSVGGPAAVDRPGAESSPFSFEPTQTLEVGENPAGMAFDPSGSGLVITVNAGDGTLSYINGPPAAPTEVNEVRAEAADLCLSTAHPCAEVPVVFDRDDTAPARAITVRVTLSPELALCGAGIEQGDWLGAFPSLFQVIDEGGGVYTVDQAILGPSCGVTTGGTLFTLHVEAGPGADPDDTGTIAVTAVDARDCGDPFGLLAGEPGPPLAVTIDRTAPAAVSDLAAAQVTTGNGADGTTAIGLSFTAPMDTDRIEVYRKGFGHHPEYDDAGGAVPATPATPAAAIAAGWGLTAVDASGEFDEPNSRDVWHYVLFGIDACDNVSAPSNRTNGTLNYHLGDLSDGSTPGTGDNKVDLWDLSALGGAYGAADGHPDYEAFADIGPTTTSSTHGRPLTDSRIQFEDLVIFAINYGGVAKPADVPVAAGRNALIVEQAPPPGAGGLWDVTLRLASDGTVQAVSAALGWNASVVEPVAVIPAEVAEEATPRAVFSPAAGTVDAASLGAPFRGEGALATVRFRVKEPGDPALALIGVAARDRANAPLELEREMRANAGDIPAVTRFRSAAPNPFHGTITLAFDLAAPGPASLRVFAIDGRLVRTVVDAGLPAGRYEVAWDGRNDAGRRMASGVYLMQFTARDAREVRRLVYLR